MNDEWTVQAWTMDPATPGLWDWAPIYRGPEKDFALAAMEAAGQATSCVRLEWRPRVGR
jgi:hypothetical protein